jgi:uncharacterized circularly permuted ATP-grasp superfamily protein
MGDATMTAPTSYRPEGDVYDEALLPDGSPRAAYGDLLDRVCEVGVDELAARVAAEVDALGATFASGDEQHPFLLDPIPRVFTAAEWERIATGVAQRARALNAFVADVYGDRRIVVAGRIPERVIDTCDHLEPRLAALDLPPVSVGVAGLDLVRYPDGEVSVLEDNVRTPSGIAYMLAARKAVARALPGELDDRVRPLGGVLGMLDRALGDGFAVLLTDGPSNSAWYEHREIARELSLPLVTLADLDVAGGRLHALVDGRRRRVDVVYRRTDEDRLSEPDGSLTAVGAALLEPLEAGTLRCVNGFGTGVADDKLVHAYVEEMVRFYLSERPILRSVPTYDLADPDARDEVLERLDELVVKPRGGYGGEGVVVGPHAGLADLRDLAHAVRNDPQSYVAQETVLLSRHPTAVDDRLEPRHVDLRPFAFAAAGAVSVASGGLTRFAQEPGALVVNSSQAGGAKDTWVLW